jgi:integrase/recombinase XerC
MSFKSPLKMELATEQPSPRTTVIQAFTQYIETLDRSPATVKTYTKNLRQFALYLLYKDIGSPQRQDVSNYKHYLQSDHYSIGFDDAGRWIYKRDTSGHKIIIRLRPNTINLYLQSVKMFFCWTAFNGIYPNIADHVKILKVDHTSHKKDALTPAQVLTIEKSIKARSAAREQYQKQQPKDTAGRVQRAIEQDKRLLALYTLAVNAGLRTIELSRASVHDIATKDGIAFLQIWGKGRAEPDQRKILSPEVYATIKDYLKTRNNPPGTHPLFTATGNRAGGQRLSPETISKLLKKAMQAAGYNSDRLTAHSLRHSAGSAAQEVTQNIYLTQKYMRHQDPKTTEIYIHDGEQEQEREKKLAQSIYKLYHDTSRGEKTK